MNECRMIQFKHATARIAASNLAGFGGISEGRVEQLAQSLALLEAEVVALVEITPICVLKQLKRGLADRGVVYQSVIK